MKEIIKKIIEVVGNENVILLGKGEQPGIKVVQPEEIDLYPKKYKSIIVESIDQLDEKSIKKLTDMTNYLWIPFSVGELINKVDATIENMIEKQEFKDINVNEKIENLRKLSGGNVFIANFHLPEMAFLISKDKEKIFAEGVEIEPSSSFFVNLSMVEYLKSKLEEVKKEKEKLEIQLERCRRDMNDWKETCEREQEIKKKMEKDHQKEIDDMKMELEKIIFEMGLKLEEGLEKYNVQKKDSK